MIGTMLSLFTDDIWKTQDTQQKKLLTDNRVIKQCGWIQNKYTQISNILISQSK